MIFDPSSSEVVHKALVRIDEANDRIFDVGGIDAASRTPFDKGDAAIDTGLPAVAVAKLLQARIRHEHDYLGLGLGAELKSNRCGGNVVIADRASAD